jgi:hypothetical protein
MSGARSVGATWEQAASQRPRGRHKRSGLGRTSLTSASTLSSVAPAASARVAAAWMTGPSASGSEYGTPSSMMSDPACATRGAPASDADLHARRPDRARLVQRTQRSRSCGEVGVARADERDERRPARRAAGRRHVSTRRCAQRPRSARGGHALLAREGRRKGCAQPVGGGGSSRCGAAHCASRHARRRTRAGRTRAKRRRGAG